MAKIKTINHDITITPEEEKFCMYKQDLLGAFSTHLYKAFSHADSGNKAKLLSTFPELKVMNMFMNDVGYWEDLKRRYNSKYPTATL